MRASLACLSLLLALPMAACGSELDSTRGGASGSGGSAGTAGGPGTGATGGSAGEGTAGAPSEAPTTPKDITPLPVELPPRPDFSLGFELGSPGWRNSTEAFCAPWVGDRIDTSLWSTPDAVYVTVAMVCDLLDPPGYCSGQRGTHYQSLFVNQGSGWKAVRHNIDNPTLWAVGTQGDALISIGACAAGKSELDGSFECLGNRPVFRSLGAVVRGDAIFHLAQNGGQASLLTKYQNDVWSEVARFEPERGAKVLLDLGDQLLVAGDDAFVAQVDPDTGATTSLAAPPGDYVDGAVLPGGKYALASAGGAVLLHDSAGWTPVGSPGTFLSKLHAAPSGAVYAVGWTPSGARELHRIDHTGASGVVLELEDGWEIQDYSVNSDTEIFLMLGGYAISQFQCGGLVMTWFDGNQLHLM